MAYLNPVGTVHLPPRQLSSPCTLGRIEMKEGDELHPLIAASQLLQLPNGDDSLIYYVASLSDPGRVVGVRKFYSWEYLLVGKVLVEGVFNVGTRGDIFEKHTRRLTKGFCGTL